MLCNPRQDRHVFTRHKPTLPSSSSSSSFDLSYLLRPPRSEERTFLALPPKSFSFCQDALQHRRHVGGEGRPARGLHQRGDERRPLDRAGHRPGQGEQGRARARGHLHALPAARPVPAAQGARNGACAARGGARTCARVRSRTSEQRAHAHAHASAACFHSLTAPLSLSLSASSPTLAPRRTRSSTWTRFTSGSAELASRASSP